VAAPSAAPPSRPDDSAAFDAEFGRALELFRKGRASEAAAAFDALRGNAAVDPGRRADALYWAARAHKDAGHAAAAEERARLAAESPGSWHAEDAALMLGEALLRRGDVAGARPLLERAARSERESVRARAERALKGAGPAPASSAP
jgi:predicted Zn-dependent protease